MDCIATVGANQSLQFIWKRSDTAANICGSFSIASNCEHRPDQSMGALNNCPLYAVRPVPEYNVSVSICFLWEDLPCLRNSMLNIVSPVQYGDAQVFSIQVTPFEYIHSST